MSYCPHGPLFFPPTCLKPVLFEYSPCYFLFQTCIPREVSLLSAILGSMLINFNARLHYAPLSNPILSRPYSSDAVPSYDRQDIKFHKLIP